MSELSSRAISAIILSKVLAHQGSLSSQLTKYNSHKDFPLIQEICFGVCRHYFPIKANISRLVEKPLRTKDLDIQCLLMVGVYQLLYMRVPDHAAVNETVDATKSLKKPWAKGLVNAVLRKAIKQENVIELLPDLDEELIYSHPTWLIAMLKLDWPDDWGKILENSNSRAPMTLRVNLIKIPRDAYLEKLRANEIGGTAGKLSKTSIYLSHPCQVETLPGFSQGEVSVQDEASQLVPYLLDLAPAHSLLDACAAPGGKTGHILECEQSLTRLIALDNKANRLAIIAENLGRLGLFAELKVADASQPDTWWDGSYFDRILLDAPCSATGVIRRHPDIKLLRLEHEIAKFSEQQLELLLAVWRVLRPGGLLLYTTCSVLKQENDGTIGRFLESQQGAKYHAITADWGVECRYGRQLLPDNEGSDGFYYSLLEKK